MVGNRTRAVMIKKFVSSGDFLFRSRDFGLILIPKSVVDQLPSECLFGDWVDCTVQTLNSVVCGCSHQATQIQENLGIILPIIRCEDKTMGLQVSAMVTTCYDNFGFLWSETLGRIQIGRGNDYSGSWPFMTETVLRCSVKPVVDSAKDYAWLSRDFVEEQNSKQQFPSIQKHIGVLDYWAGHGYLMVEKLGKVFFSYNDYFMCARVDESLLRKYKEYETMIVPTTYGHSVKWRAVYVKPVGYRQEEPKKLNYLKMKGGKVKNTEVAYNKKSDKKLDNIKNVREAEYKINLNRGERNPKNSRSGTPISNNSQNVMQNAELSSGSTVIKKPSSIEPLLLEPVVLMSDFVKKKSKTGESQPVPSAIGSRNPTHNSKIGESSGSPITTKLSSIEPSFEQLKTEVDKSGMKPVTEQGSPTSDFFFDENLAGIPAIPSPPALDSELDSQTSAIQSKALPVSCNYVLAPGCVGSIRMQHPIQNFKNDYNAPIYTQGTSAAPLRHHRVLPEFYGASEQCIPCLRVSENKDQECQCGGVTEEKEILREIFEDPVIYDVIRNRDRKLFQEIFHATTKRF